MSACIIPTSFGQETPVTTHAPEIVANTAMPPFGLLSTVKGISTPFKVEVDDDDSDQIFARLFAALGSPPTKIDDTEGSSAGDPDHPSRFLVSFAARDLCSQFEAEATTTDLDITLVVSDLAFSDQLTQATSGLTNSQVWVLSCH
jgi:hypothetical protein